MTTLPRFLTVTLFAALSVVHAQTEAVSLRLRWQPGKVYLQENTTETTTHGAELSSSEQHMRVVQTTEMKVKEETATKNHLVDVTFASIKGEINANGKATIFDSSKPEESNPMLQQALGRALGKTFTLAYNEQDQFLDVRNLSSLATEKGSITSLSAMADSKDVAMLFRKSLEIALPAEPVAPSGTWTTEETLVFPSTGEVLVKIQGTFAGIEEREGRKHAKLVFDGKFGSAPPRPDKPISMVEITSDSTISGILYFDMERQVVSFGAYTSRIKLSAAGQIYPLEQKVSSKLLSITDIPSGS